MPAARGKVEGRWHLWRDNNNVLLLQLIHQILKIYLLFCLKLGAYVYAETTLLNITDHHLWCQARIKAQ